jgi:hypothetical protein
MSLNPIDWLAWIYGKWFQSYPVTGGIAVVTLFALVGLILWFRAIDTYKEAHALPKAQAVTGSTPETPITAQRSAPVSEAPKQAARRNREVLNPEKLAPAHTTDSVIAAPAYHGTTGNGLATKPISNTTEPAQSIPLIQQGPGSVAQVGGQNNSVTVNNFVPPDRHLVSSEITELEQIAVQMPDDAKTWFYVDSLNQPEATTFASEIYDVFGRHGKAADGPVIWMITTAPTPKGTHVLAASKDDVHFSTAQAIATVLAKYLPTGTVTFERGIGLRPGDVKLLIGVP